MIRKTILLAILLTGAALAGCTDDTGGDDTATPTPTTSETTSPTSPTNVLDQPPVACPDAPTTNATGDEAMGYPAITFTVSEPTEENPCFAFVGPASVSAGWTAVTLNNTGMAMHIMPMFFVGERSDEEIAQALAAEETPEWVVPVGGVGVATPFASGTALMNLQEGRYVLVCFIEGHHMQGMWRVLNVTAAEGEARPAPEAAFTVTLMDYNFSIPENVTAGLQVFRVVNNGTEPHEAPLLMVNEGHTFEELLQALENPQGPPPGAGVGGVNFIPPGAEAYAIADLHAGTTYGFVCFVESDAHAGAPHIALGMAASFTPQAAA